MSDEMTAIPGMSESSDELLPRLEAIIGTDPEARRTLYVLGLAASTVLEATARANPTADLSMISDTTDVVARLFCQTLILAAAGMIDSEEAIEYADADVEVGALFSDFELIVERTA